MKCRNCNNEALKGRTICQKCKYLREKEIDPVRLSFRRLRNHAKERGKEFDLSFDEFKKFCYETEYISRKGISKNNFHRTANYGENYFSHLPMVSLKFGNLLLPLSSLAF